MKQLLICMFTLILVDVMGYIRPLHKGIRLIHKPSMKNMVETHVDNMSYENEEDYTNPITGGSTALQQLILEFDCDQIDSDTISEFLFELGCLSVSCEVDTERKYYLEEKKWSDIIKTKNWKTAILRANFPSSFDVLGLTDVIKLSFPDIQFDFQQAVVDDKDWILHVQSSWEPMVLNDLTISFPWHHTTSTTPTDSNLSDSVSNIQDITNDLIKKTPIQITTPHHIVLEGGAAFGTGDHPTTRLCMKYLQRMIPTYTQQHQQQNQQQESSQSFLQSGSTSPCAVLDYGCGSAILGIVSLIYGATESSGVDIDIDSLISARWNCERNKLQMNLFLANEDGIDSDEEKSITWNQFKGKNDDYIHESNKLMTIDHIPSNYYQITIANILAPILIHLAPKLAEYTTNNGGRIALSGVLKNQSEKIISIYSEYFNDMRVEDEEDDWVLITGIKK